MSKTGFDDYREPIPRLLLVAAAVVIVALGAFLAKSMKETSSSSTALAVDKGLTISLAVEPFDVGDSVTGAWDSSAFAESLATRLSRVPGLRAEAGGGEARSHYSLRGSVAMKEGRLILATRLGRHGEGDTMWTATFWRSASSSTTLLSDLAAAVAEAAFNAKVQESLAAKRERP